MKVGRLADGGRYIATIEPWHGFQVVVYTPPTSGTGLWERRVIDEPVAGGHAVWCADLDGDGDQELIVGTRDKGSDPSHGPGVVGLRPLAGVEAPEVHPSRHRRWRRRGRRPRRRRPRRRRPRRDRGRRPCHAQRQDLLEPGQLRREVTRGEWRVGEWRVRRDEGIEERRTAIVGSGRTWHLATSLLPACTRPRRLPLLTRTTRHSEETTDESRGDRPPGGPRGAGGPRGRHAGGAGGTGPRPGPGLWAEPGRPDAEPGALPGPAGGAAGHPRPGVRRRGRGARAGRDRAAADRRPGLRDRRRRGDGRVRRQPRADGRADPRGPRLRGGGGRPGGLPDRVRRPRRPGEGQAGREGPDPRGRRRGGLGGGPGRPRDGMHGPGDVADRREARARRRAGARCRDRDHARRTSRPSPASGRGDGRRRRDRSPRGVRPGGQPRGARPARPARPGRPARRGGTRRSTSPSCSGSGSRSWGPRSGDARSRRRSP